MPSKKLTPTQRVMKESYKHLGTYQGVEEYELRKNGLRVLYRFDDTAPVVGFMVTYLVGSRYEATGHTGSTHILEHLMFKGTKLFPQKNGKGILEAFDKRGGVVNATTWMDRTNYYEVLPDEHFAFAVQVEADRMRNAIITKKYLEEELPAVLSEYAMHAESDPVDLFDEHLSAISYLAHPYHHTTIGWLSDIEHASVDTLKRFYDTYYHPNNAVVTVIGNVERSSALALIEKHFGVHPRSPREIPRPHTTEPTQYGRRTFELCREGTKDIVAIAYKVPHALHEDMPALMVLSAILGDGKMSRAYKALVQKKIASSVWSSCLPLFDPSLLSLYAMPNEGVAHEKVEMMLYRLIETIQEKGVEASELERTLAKVSTEIAFARDGHYATLSALNESIAVGDWRFFFDLPRKLTEVTVEDVRRVAKQYCVRTSSTVGYYRTQKQK